MIATAVQSIFAARSRADGEKSLLVAVTGIDASGKGYLAARIAERIELGGLRVANINIDGWLNLPDKRFHPDNPAQHFYDHAIRFDDLFAQLVLPLKDHRSIDLVMDFVSETAISYRAHRYEFREIDVILLEGIFLLKRRYRNLFDVSFWIDCTLETALERAQARNQEEMTREEIARAYRTIYFPAQRIHFLRDAPRTSASVVIANDPLLEARSRSAGHG